MKIKNANKQGTRRRTNKETTKDVSKMDQSRYYQKGIQVTARIVSSKEAGYQTINQAWKEQSMQASCKNASI